MTDKYVSDFKERFGAVNCRQLTRLNLKTQEGIKEYFARVHDYECTERLKFAVERAVEILWKQEIACGEVEYGQYIFGPPIHGVGIEFEEAPLPRGHAFFHGEKEPPPVEANEVISVGNCGLYTGPWGVRVEDTVVVGPEESIVLTNYPRRLER